MDSAGPAAGRTQAFGQGVQGTPEDVASSLNADSQRQNDLVPKSFQAHSVLQQYIPSPNGLGETDVNRRLVGGGMLPTANGMSASTYAAERPITNTTLNA